jgi:hypothetical protein
MNDVFMFSSWDSPHLGCPTMTRTGGTLYDQLGVDPNADVSTIRIAFRSKAKLHHPDTSTVANSTRDGADDMAALNEAWAVLSDPDRRAAYDQTLLDRSGKGAAHSSTITTTSYVAEKPRFARREAWTAGQRVQIVRLTREAVNSASWALSLKRHGRPREVYLAQLDPVIHHLIQDTAERMKLARAAGAAPLDLALATALIGLADLAAQLARDVGVTRPSPSTEVLSELIDKTWDNLAHGVSHEVEVALGGNPHVGKIVAKASN